MLGFSSTTKPQTKHHPKTAHATASSEYYFSSAFRELRVLTRSSTDLVPNRLSTWMKIRKRGCKTMCLDVLNSFLSSSANLYELSRCAIQLLFPSASFSVQESAMRLSDSQRILLISEAAPPNFLSKSIDFAIDKDVVNEVRKMF